MAARSLARSGAKVALIDKAAFPRDKACGDLVGPQGLALLDQERLVPDGAVVVGDMALMGPGGNRRVLPAVAGTDHPGRALSMPRSSFDAHLHQAALEMGAMDITGQVVGLDGNSGAREIALAGGASLLADWVIGADGASSAVGSAAHLSDANDSMFGFAIRRYVKADLALPIIFFWSDSALSHLPGYGWAFPGPDGTVNAGLGVAVGANRRAAAVAAKRLDPFIDSLSASGVLAGYDPGSSSRPLGGWLRMGLAGIRPARGRVLLVGDAAGLVNPMQGEGIAQAMHSGIAASRSIVASPANAAGNYTAWIRDNHAGFHGSTAALQRLVLEHPSTMGLFGAVLTGPWMKGPVAQAWGMYWNELLAGATPGTAKSLAMALDGAVRLSTSLTRTRRQMRRALRWA